jgi:2-keto-4-pentenoate hydratase/2-oxohepta-3-ene-1,7-dioic acid hydratase in catechol pathway
MKIGRFLTADERIIYGSPLPENSYRVRKIEGDIFGDFRPADGVVEIRRILPPLDPPNILALGLNYRRHADELGAGYPDFPILFIKATNSIAGPGDPILLPKAGPLEVDYEAELAVVIGRRAKNVEPGEALDYVLGYTCANDVSARDWQFRKQNQQWSRGKSFDTFCPIGPFIITRDEVPDPQDLRISALLNGGVVQDSCTSDMIFDIRQIVSGLSRSMTMPPGTIILTGTPEGVGFTRKPPIFLRHGDIITVSIEGIGELTNIVRIEE